ncbi:MAG: tetratricopeptide repeat protein [Acidobacteriota bacterium]|nr:tetratricopeptide repeat protein [Acidobacteriota bacterium]
MADVEQETIPPEKRPANESPVPETAARTPGIYHRERVLIACAVLLVALFAFTAFIARQYHRMLHRIGDQWYANGEAAMKAGQTLTAVTDYRNALVYKPDDEGFQFHLALALAGAGKEDEARSYLTTLLTESPGSGPVNLALARVAANSKDSSDAIRYYHSAIYGVWNNDPLRQRWEVRRELSEYLLDRNDLRDAEPDLIALAQEAPPNDLGSQRIAGDLLLRANFWSRALAAYRAVLAANHRDPDALAGAGRAAFELAMYSDAADYFRRLPPRNRAAPPIADDFTLSQEAATMNALRLGLRASEAARRAVRALAVAESRISGCAKQRGEELPVRPNVATPPTSLQKLYSTGIQNRRLWSEVNLAHHPDQVVAAMTFAVQAESVGTAECGPPQTLADRALSLIASSAARPPSE